MNATVKAPEIGKFLDPEEKELVQSFEAGGSLFKSGLTTKRRREIESMARAAVSTSARESRSASRSATSSGSNLVRSRRGVSYQALINALIHRYVSD
jgi:hypothetical protein